jgi:hypothetical protein
VLAVLTGFIIAIPELKYHGNVFLVVAFELLLAGLPVIGHSLACAVQIRRSIARYERRQLVSAGYGGK